MISTLQHAIPTSVSFSIIATDEWGDIQLFDAGAERMLCHTAADVAGKLRPTDLHDSIEVSAWTEALAAAPENADGVGRDSLALEGSGNIDHTFDLTSIRKDGTHFPSLVSVTSLCDGRENIIGYL